MRAPEGRHKIARRWSPARGGTPGKGHKNKCEPRRGGIKRGTKYGIVSKCRKHKKHAPTPARSFASLRSSPLYVTTGSLGSISFFVAIQGFGASSLRFLRPRRPFADAHSTACLRAAAPLPRGFEFRSPTARKLIANFRFIEQFAIN